MIAACPKCHTRYRVEPDRLGPDGARLRCSQCSAVFRVRLPADSGERRPGAPDAAPAPEVSRPAAPPPVAPPVATPSAPPAAAVEPVPSVAGPAPAPSPADEPPAVTGPEHADEPHFDRERLVLVAHANTEACKRLAERLERSGLEVLVAHDGVEAILGIQRALPRAVVLDAGLPKMFGFQVCELVKRNESLRGIHVCLVGTVHRDHRYRRAPSELYGADFYLEPRALPDALLDWLGRVGLTLDGRSEAAPIPEPPSEPAPHVVAPASPAPTRAPVAPPARPASPAAYAPVGPVRLERPPAATADGAPAADPFAAERAQAERLARIVVSDIVLYNEEKFAAALRSGNVLEAMRDELEEGRALFRERIDARVRDERDFLADELVRVARTRGRS